MVGDRGNPKHVRQHELRVAVLGIFLEQLVQYLSRFDPILREQVPSRLPELLCALSSSTQRCVEREMTQQVERIGVWLVRSVRELSEINATFFQPLNQLRPLLGVGPSSAKFWRCGAQRADSLGCLLGVPHYSQLMAVSVELVHQMRRDLDVPLVEVVLPTFSRRWVDELRTDVVRI